MVLDRAETRYELTRSFQLSHRQYSKCVHGISLLASYPPFVTSNYRVRVTLTLPLLLPVLHSQPLSITYHDIVLCLHSYSLLSSQGHVLTLALVAIHMHPLPTFWHKYYRKKQNKKTQSGHSEIRTPQWYSGQQNVHLCTFKLRPQWESQGTSQH